MLSISTISRQEKNKLHTGSAFIILLDIVPNVTGAETIRVCYNNEDITWNGNIYQGFPFEIGEVSQDNTGSEPSVELKVDNVSRAMQSYVEDYKGGNGFTVLLRVVNTEAIAQGVTDAELEERFKVNHCTVEQNFITFTLGTGYSLSTRRPLDRYLKNSCPFVYKGLRCACTSSLTTCGHTLTECRARGNSARFGGFPGIDQKGVYLNG